MEHEGTKRHGLLRLQFNIILVNIAMKHFLNVTVLRVKVYKDLDGIGIYHEESK